MKTESKTLQPGKTSGIQTAFRFLLGIFLVFAGINHLSFGRVEFLAQVPPWVPLSGDLVVVLSGVAEIALGLGLIFLAKRARAGWPGRRCVLCADLPREYLTVCQPD